MLTYIHLVGTHTANTFTHRETLKHVDTETDTASHTGTHRPVTNYRSHTQADP